MALGGLVFSLALAVGGVLFYWLSVRVSHAGHGRALQIAE
jgi:hypothetical protein